MNTTKSPRQLRMSVLLAAVVWTALLLADLAIIRHQVLESTRQLAAVSVSFGAVWLLGLAGGWLAYRRVAQTRRREALTAQAAERTRRIVEYSNCVLFSWSPDVAWRVEFVTGNVARWGVAADDLMRGTITFADLVHPDDRERVIGEVRDHTAGGAGEFYQTYRIVTAAGEVRWVDDWTVVERDGAGRARQYHGLLTDVTELHEARRELELSHRRLDLALQGADLGLWDWNARTGDVVFNERWAEMLGWRLDEIVCTVDTWKDWIHPDDRDQTLAALAEHLAGRTASYESLHRLRHRDGSWRWILDRGRVVERDAGGQPLRLTGTHLDLTDRKREQEELLELERASQEAMRLESLGILAGGVAHDFNNQLQIIQGNTELVREGLGGDSADGRLLDAVLTAAARSAAVCEQMLVYSGRGTQGRVWLGFADLVQQRAGRLQPDVAVDLDLAADAASDRILGDPRQLQQLVDNLLANAHDAGAGGSPWLGVRVDRAALTRDQLAARPGLRRLEPGSYLCLTVEDRGEGMDAETLARAHEPFFSTRIAGRGLGLAVVHGVLRNHGGGLHLTSAPGQGTRCEAFLPLTPGGDRAADGRAAPDPGLASAPEASYSRFAGI